MLLSRLVAIIGLGIALYSLLFHGLTDVAFLSADEPRYAAIGRDMAATGDWITPRLNGQPWFEKPPLLYWLTAASWTVGLRDELAARLPVALLSAAFLIFFFFRLRRDFGHAPALASASILATSIGWIAFSNVAVTDLPLAVFFSAAMLLALPAPPGAAERPPPLATGVLLGLAMLAKGLVPVVLCPPALYFCRRHWRRLLAIAALAIAVFLAWFLAATAQHGAEPFRELILKHHLSRFFGGDIHHERPVWFYVPILLGGLLPWTPALVCLRPRAGVGHAWTDPRLQYLAAWAIFGLLFFSASTNKLPGYLLPVLPPIAALVGIRSHESLAHNRPLRLAIAAMLPLLVLGAQVLPDALTDGLTRAPLQPRNIALMAASAAGAFVSPPYTVAALALWAKLTVYPVIDAHLGARRLWNEIKPRAADTCIEWIGRDWRYGLDYYAQPPLPDCATEQRPLALTGENGVRPSVRPSGSSAPDGPHTSPLPE